MYYQKNHLKKIFYYLANKSILRMQLQNKEISQYVDLVKDKKIYKLEFQKPRITKLW